MTPGQPYADPISATGRSRSGTADTRDHILATLPVIRDLPALGVAPAVAVGVEHGCCPAMRLGGVPGLAEHGGVEPADDRTAAALKRLRCLGQTRNRLAANTSTACAFALHLLTRGLDALARTSSSHYTRVWIRPSFEPLVVQ